MIQVEKIKPTGLFTNYIYKAIPLAFDESMSYYETLSGLVSYLKELPPESALNAKGFDALVSSLDGGLTKENNLEARTR